MPPGQTPGHTDGYTWADLVDHHTTERGTLAAVALHLAEHRAFTEDVESVERGLRRLRRRGTADGGVWGERLVRVLGLPTALTDRIRWMGQYHTRFTDLPASICAELIRPYDRPPITTTPARIWLLLARTNLVLRRRADPTPLLDNAAHLAPHAEPAARIEHALVTAYHYTRPDPPRAAAALDTAAAHLDAPTLTPTDRANLHARYIDHRAYPKNRPRFGPPDHPAALALYHQIPPDAPLFARVRRHNGLGWTHLKLGDRALAATHARRSIEAAGDLGSLRLRAMALNLLAAATDDPERATAKARALAIATHLEDEALLLRFAPDRPRPESHP